MKKIFAALMALALAATCAACGDNGGSSSTADSSENGDSGSSAVSASEDKSWEKVESAGTLVLGLDDAFPPMGYKDTETGDIIGFDIDIAKEVCSRLGIELKLQPIDWNNKQSELENGNVDCLWNGFSKTPERDEQFNLSIPYMKNEQIILVKTDSDYQTLEDLAGKTIGVQADSSAESALEEEENKDFKDSLNEIVKIDDYALAVLEIQNGTIDAISIDEVVARFYLKNDPDAYRILSDSNGEALSLATEDYVIGFRKGDNALKAKIEETLKEMSKDGTMKTISEKWFDEDVTTVE